jgi:predicted Zn-dependent peptidase
MPKKIILKNGLRLILVPQPSSLAATVFVMVEAGSEYETKDINGISHFLEHLVFKGTMNRPKPGTIASELDALGAEYNAFTGQEETAYYAKAQSHKLEQIIDLVSDMYLNPIFNPQEIEKERGVIIEEINLYLDTPTRQIHSTFNSLLYGDQPAGWDIAGEKQIIQKLQRDDFVNYRTKHYVPAATTVVVAGAFNEKKVVKQIESLFAHLPKLPKGKKGKTVEKQKKPQMILKHKDSDQSHLILGCRAFDIFDPRRHALQVMGEILGGGMSSRLWIRVREELGAAYYVRAHEDLARDHGAIYFSAGVDVTKIEKVIQVIIEELNRIKREAVPADELRKGKDHMIGNLILSLETSDELASFYGIQETLTGDVKTVEELIKKIEGVKAAEIQKLAKQLFTNDKLNLAIIGPYKSDEKFKKILAF